MKKNALLFLNLFLAAVLLSGCASNASAAANMFTTEPLAKGNLAANIIEVGSVRPERMAVLSWQTTGQVEEVDAVLLGQVSEGQVLATLKRSSLGQSVIMAQSDLVAAQEALEDLQNVETAQAEADVALLQAQKAYDDAVKKRAKLDRGRASQETIDSAEAGYILAQEEVDVLQGIYNNTMDLPEDDPARAMALANLANAKKARDKALANVNWYKGHASETEIAEADANVALTEAQLADARRRVEELKNGPSTADLAAAQARIDAAQAILDTASLKAPFAGVITVSDAIVGELVQPGIVGYQIEDWSHLYVNVEVSEVDINRVAVGQPVTITFDAIYGKEYSGVVTEVGASGVRSTNVVRFPVVVEVTDPDEAVKTGMTAAVTIEVEEVIDVLMIPNQAVRIVDGNQVVFIQRGDGTLPERVQVKLGLSSDTHSQLLEGDLKAGDLIVLNPDMLVGPMAGVAVGG